MLERHLLACFSIMHEEQGTCFEKVYPLKCSVFHSKLDVNGLRKYSLFDSVPVN